MIFDELTTWGNPGGRHEKKRIPDAIIHRLREMRREGRRVSDIAVSCGVCPSTVRRYSRGIKPAKQAPVDRFPERCAELRRNGFNAQEIAYKLSSTKDKVLEALSVLGHELLVLGKLGAA